MRSLFFFIVLLLLFQETASRGGRGGRKGKGKSNLQFSQIAEFSLIHTQLTDNRSAHIVSGSHFSQTFRLGYKLVLICTARGDPRPTIIWFKEGAELVPKPHIHHYEQLTKEGDQWSKLEIDPATMGDQGVYACLANNEHGVMAKNFKAEYAY